MRTEAIERVTVTPTAEAISQITRLCAAAPGVETGGLIIESLGHGFATGPGPAAVQEGQALEWDASYIAGILDALAHAGVWKVVARWHKHTSPIVLASAQDRLSAMELLRVTGDEELVDVIVACDAEDRPISWAAYMCRPGSYERVNLEPPERSA